MFKATLKAPFKQMMKNAGLEEMLQGSYWNIDEGFGINFRTKEVVDMVASGIIDPFKVTRLALESAVAVALNLITTETAIVNIEPLTQQ